MIKSLAVFCEANYVYHEFSTNTIGTNPIKFLDVLTPSVGQPVKVGFKIEWQFYWNEARIYYTNDGTNPSGSFGVGFGSTQVLNATFDHNFGSPIVDVVSATIPGQPPGTTIKYIVSAWHSGGGDEIFGNGCGNSPNPFCTSETNSSNVAFIFSYTVSSTHVPSIRINEFSQGLSGAKEWVELLVTSTTPVGFASCSTVRLDISNWILDDNNGDFSPLNHFTGSGLATGHLRFKNQPPWNNLPVGSIIVIYNSADKDIVTNFPADDPTDDNGDCVYVLPSNHTSLEYCTTLPVATSCTVRTDYASCVYGAAGTWANIGLANAGDAIQIRDPSFNLIHGLVYGRATSASGCTTTDPMVGNALAPVISPTAMSGTSAAFNGTIAADFYDATKWVIQSASLATPGWANNLNDSLYIKNDVRGGCTCSQVLPLDETNRPLAGLVRKNYVKLNAYTIKSNFGLEKHNQTIMVYDVGGRLIFQTTSFIRGAGEVNLYNQLALGVNLIKVIIDNKTQDQYTFKVVK